MIYSVVTIAYLSLLIGVIIYKSRSVKDEEDFVVAGRGVPVYLLVGTLVCTWIGSGSLFGTAGLSFRTGFGELWFSAGAWIGIVVIYFIAARVRKISKFTLTDILEQRYNHTAKILGTVTIIVAYLVIAGYQFKGGGRFLAILSNGAIDVETGRRLNIFFGENSCYTSSLDPGFTGRDMLWNPTNQFARDNPQAYYDLVLGGQHWVYVTYTSYDGCEAIRKSFTPETAPTPSSADVFKVLEAKNIAWAGMLPVAPNYQMRSLREGLIPNDAVIKLRVTKPYDTWFNDADNNRQSGNPLYQFKIQDRQAQALDQVQVENALDSVKVVPNPYYGFSQYETSQFSNVIKITNLPAKCTVTIYSLDGKFIRQYNRDEVYEPYMQIAPDLEWDLKNNKGIPVASGVYLIQVQAPGMGERTIKWFGIARQFDPSGL